MWQRMGQNLNTSSLNHADFVNGPLDFKDTLYMYAKWVVVDKVCSKNG